MYRLRSPSITSVFPFRDLHLYSLCLTSEGESSVLVRTPMLIVSENVSAIKSVSLMYLWIRMGPKSSLYSVN